MDHPCGHSFCENCRTVVTRAYRRLRELGSDDRSAFQSSVTLLSLRHPGLGRRDYVMAVADWLSDET
jgi:hypothetical protein